LGGHLAALESIHAVAWVIKHARRRWTKKDVVIINLLAAATRDVQQICGRGKNCTARGLPRDEG